MTEPPVPITASQTEPVHVSVDQDPARQWGRLFITILLPILTAILSTALCLSVSERNAQRGRESRAELQRTQCAIVVALDENYRDAPPETELGQRNASSMRQLRQSLGCDPRG